MTEGTSGWRISEDDAAGVRAARGVIGWKRFALAMANVLLIGGAAAISVLPAAALHPPVFVWFLTGHLVWLLHAVRQADRSLAALNAGMVLLDLYAIGIRL